MRMATGNCIGPKEVVFTVVAMVGLAGLCWAGLPEAHAFVGPGHSGPGSMSEPPFNPAAWHKVEGDVLSIDDVWGRRVKPRGVFEIPGGVGVLYNSKPPEGYEDGARDQTGSLAFSRNLVDWEDYAGNPVLYEVQDWQGSFRAMPRAMMYDEANKQWVVYFGDSHGDYPGIRGLGTAYSTDLVNWTYEDGPTITIADYAAAVPERIEATDEELAEEGRVYAEWAIHYEGRYYIRVSGTNRTGENRRSSAVVLVSDSPGGPFDEVEEFDGDLIPQTRPVYWEGKWYTAITRTWDDTAGIGLAVSDDLMGPYEENPENPIFTIETTSRARPQLFRYGGVWAVLYCHTYDTLTNMSLRIAISDVHPSIIP